MSWKWFGVKTIYRSESIGKPKSVDSDFDRDATLVEERIVLFRARTFDEAIAKAEAEANVYASRTYKNVYGQRVKARYLKACDAFELFDDPGSGVEVFSTTEIIGKSVSDKVVVDQYLGKVETRTAERSRHMFYNGELR